MEGMDENMNYLLRILCHFYLGIIYYAIDPPVTYITCTSSVVAASEAAQTDPPRDADCHLTPLPSAAEACRHASNHNRLTTAA